MNSHVFMNGLGSEVYIMDDKVDPNLIPVMPDSLNNLQCRRYQQPEMVPDVAKDGGLQYECIPGQEWNPAMHPTGCQCQACRDRRVMDHVAIYQDLGYMQNAARKFIINIRDLAFDTQSTKDYNHTSTLLRMYNSPSTPVLSKHYYIRLLYTLIASDEHGTLVKTQDGAIQSEANRHYYMCNDQDQDGFWTYQFMDLHNTDVITIPTMYNAADITLNIRGIEVYARTTGYSLDVKPDSINYINTGIKDILLFKDMFGVEYRGYAYPVMPHDRVRVNFSVIFNNLTFIADITNIQDVICGLDYRTCDFDTVPSWNGIKLATGTNIINDNFIRTTNPYDIQKILTERLDKIPIPA